MAVVLGPEVTPAPIPGEYSTDEWGLQYAGVHITIDMWGAESLDDADVVDAALRTAVQACGATLLELTMHRFAPQGLTAVAVLSESHLSIHCWPENGYAAIDVFTCGSADPRRAITVLREAFRPSSLQVCELKRGMHSA